MRKQNRTVLNIASGRMRFKRRLDLPMWHHDHLPKIVQLLRKVQIELRRLINLKNCATLIKRFAVPKLLLQRHNCTQAECLH